MLYLYFRQLLTCATWAVVIFMALLLGPATFLSGDFLSLLASAIAAYTS